MLRKGNNSPMRASSFSGGDGACNGNSPTPMVDGDDDGNGDNDGSGDSNGQQRRQWQWLTAMATDVSCLERYCTNILLACLTKVRRYTCEVNIQQMLTLRCR